MLVITRKQEQRIQIGKDISILVVSAAGQVKIGIEAPRELAIRRDDAKATTPHAK